MPCNNINATTKAQRCTYGNDRYRGIISHLAQIDANKEGSTAPLINNLEIIGVFKDKDEEKEVSVIDLIRQVSQLLKVELKELVDMAQAIMELIELYDEEQ